MASPKTPADRAIADVEKAIKAHDAALEKADVAQAKADELKTKAKRANRELQWVALHPELPEDFNLDDFRRSLEAPFDELGNDNPALEEETEVEKEADIPAKKIETEDIAEVVDVPAEPAVEAVVTDAAIGDADGDEDPWADEA